MLIMTYIKHQNFKNKTLISFNNKQIYIHEHIYIYILSLNLENANLF